MKVTIKKLQGGECDLEISPDTLISEIKRNIAAKLGIPVGEQKLLLLGRALADEQTVQSYPSLKDGTKLNLIVKKPDSLLEVSIKYFKKLGASDAEALTAANNLVRVFAEKFSKFSWDDLNKLTYDCLLSEGYSMESDTTIDGTYAV